MRVPYYTIASLPSMLRRAIDPSSKNLRRKRYPCYPTKGDTTTSTQSYRRGATSTSPRASCGLLVA